MWTHRIPRPEAVELHLEELDAHSWLKAVPDLVSEPYGRGLYRFVVVPAANRADHSLRDHLAASVSFPALRLQDPDKPTQPDAWLDVARQRLTDLDLELVREGWRRRQGRGRYWWSLAYDAPPETADRGRERSSVEEAAA
jgi:hypothetical protein